MSLLSAIKSELAGLFHLLLPPSCPLCRCEPAVVSPSGLCPSCLDQLPPLPSPRCPRCALPYQTDSGSDHLCEACLRLEPDFSHTLAVGSYAGLLRDAVHRFKFDNAIHLDRALAWLLADRFALEMPGYRPDLILPVPLHIQRLRQRSYNQSLLLARRLGTHWRVPVSSRRLIRTRATTPQQELDLAIRQQNLRQAFALTAPLQGESVLLVDDVMTTGTTLRECARLLRGGGAGEIRVAVVGRALRHH